MVWRSWFWDFGIAISWLSGVVLLGSLAVWFLEGSIGWQDFLAWDADFYYRIAREGYGISQTAFFPLFPWLWRLLGGEIWTGIVLNIFLYGATFVLINQLFSLNTFQKLLFLSIPSSFFYGMPYSESVFAVVSVGILLALMRKNTFLLILLFGIITLSRPAFSILLPALWIVLYIDEEMSKSKKWFIVIGCLLSSLLGLYVVNAYQYSFTGVWGGFYKIQSIRWENTLGLPRLPVRTNGGSPILRLDLLALWLGGIATFILLNHLVLKKDDFQLPMRRRRIVVFSLLYVAGICTFVLLMRDGSLYSLNRFVFATTFGSIFWALLPELKVSKQVVFLLGIILVLLSGYVHIQVLLGAAGLFIPLLLIAFIHHTWAKYLLILLSISYQMYLCQHFLRFQWVA